MLNVASDGVSPVIIVVCVKSMSPPHLAAGTATVNDGFELTVIAKSIVFELPQLWFAVTLKFPLVAEDEKSIVIELPVPFIVAPVPE
jgi:hypothetical protein